MSRVRLAQFDEKRRAEAQPRSELERIELPRSLWIDARPHAAAAEAFARGVLKATTRPIVTLHVNRNQATYQGVGMDTHAELRDRVAEHLASDEPAAWLLLGEHAGALFTPSWVVQLGPPALFAHAPASAGVIRLRDPRPEVADALGRGFATT